MNLLHGLLLFTTLPLKITGESFSRSHTAVWFNPFVTDADIGVWNVNALLPMISTISTKFSKLMVVGDHSARSTLIPSAVATYNKIHRDLHQLPLEVLLTFDTSMLLTGSVQTGFDVAKQLADGANQIYPGTIKKVYFQYNESSFSLDILPILFTSIQSRLNNTDYEWGAILPMASCVKFSLKVENWFSAMLPFVQHTFFSWLPEEESLQSGPRNATRRIAKLFGSCLEKFQRQKRSVLFGLLTGWVHTNESNNRQHNKYLVRYWEKVNKWAVKSNAPLVLYQAFDTPFQKQGYSKTGWWRLVPNSSYYHPSQYVFEEKRAATKPQAIMKEASGTYVPILVLAVGVIVLLCAALLATTIYLVKFLRQKQANCRLEQEHAITNTKFRELRRTDFNIDRNTPLGTGVFGVVYRGTVQNINCDELKVAVKTTSKSAAALNGLLSEIKILSHLEMHTNIVSIVGAYTEEIQKGKLYLFLELCSLGALGQYLRENISKFKNEQGQLSTTPRRTKNDYDEVVIQIRDRGLNQVCIKTKETENNDESGMKQIEGDKARTFLNTKDLDRWTCEIANGMEFLASKKVVHADLATRNVLLTHDKRAKISDFGLSRRLYEYSMYVKTQQEPMPWRWMAPESIRRLEFNEKTDVWSFGVTMWEIYSLGDVPFGGLSWNPTFISQLAQGLRLPQPAFCDHHTYLHMVKCWNDDPSKRPTFSELNSFLK